MLPLPSPLLRSSSKNEIISDLKRAAVEVGSTFFYLGNEWQIRRRVAATLSAFAAAISPLVSRS